MSLRAACPPLLKSLWRFGWHFLYILVCCVATVFACCLSGLTVLLKFTVFASLCLLSDFVLNASYILKESAKNPLNSYHLSFSAWNIWNLSKPSPVSSGQIWPCAARAAGGASTWPCRRVRIEGRCPAFASGVGTQRMSVICICGAHSALMYMFVPLTLSVSSKSESQCLCSQRQLLWHAMAIYVAYDSQRGTNHQLSTLLSLCACTCHSKSLVLAWTTPSSTTKSPIVGGILAPRKENLCLTRWSFSVYKQDFIKPSEAWWVCLASTRWARETWRCLWPLIYFGPQTFSTCCRCHCKALSIITNPRRRGIKTLHCWTELPNCTKGPRNALTEQAMRADLTSDETSGCVHCSCFISKSQFHTRLNRAILRYFQAHRGTYVKFSCWSLIAASCLPMSCLNLLTWQAFFALLLLLKWSNGSLREKK